MESVLDRARSIAPWIVERRRHLHENPELSFAEADTAAFVEAELRALGIAPTATRLNGNYSLLADLPGRDPSRAIALRADMDALPIHEAVDWPHRSRRDGVGHLCGHDAHTAMLLGAARILAERRDALPCSVRLFFQGGEERMPGGARDFIDTGILDGVDAVFGLHVDPTADVGVLRSVAGPAMAGVDEFRIRVRGVGGHAAFPHRARDPILAAAHIVAGLQQAVSRREDPLVPGVLTVASIHGGSAFNVIPDLVEMTGTVRSFRPDMSAFYDAVLEECAGNIARAFGCEAEVESIHGYPPVTNDAEALAAMAASAAEVFDAGLAAKEPVMGAEDFALYTARKPGAFAFLGCSAPDDAERFMLHHPRFSLDEGALPLGAAVLAGVALRGGQA